MPSSTAYTLLPRFKRTHISSVFRWSTCCVKRISNALTNLADRSGVIVFMLPTLSIRSSNEVVVRLAVFSAESFWYQACALEKTDRIDDLLTTDIISWKASSVTNITVRCFAWKWYSFHFSINFALFISRLPAAT